MELAPRCCGDPPPRGSILTHVARRTDLCRWVWVVCVAACATNGARAHRFIQSQRVDLVGIRSTLGVARGCKDRLDASRALRRREVDGARCRTRRYRGTVAIIPVDGTGQHGPVIAELPVDDGAFHLEFADLERLVDDPRWTRVELGHQAWAGVVHLDRLRHFRWQWHRAWVSNGRGSAGLFLAIHPDEPVTTPMEALAVEDRLLRQEADYVQVARGRLSAERFLARHVWSPFRESVRQLRGKKRK